MAALHALTPDTTSRVHSARIQGKRCERHALLRPAAKDKRERARCVGEM